MGETANIAAIASVISADIFKFFKWHTHPKKDDNFDCVNEEHKGSDNKPKNTHPTDVVFSYDDPYSGRRVNLLTDLKSYAGKSISHTKIRSALKSLAMSVECASQSAQWRQKFGVTESDPNEVRGLLFVHNHDFKFQKSFYDELRKVHTNTLPIGANSILHYLGPQDIQRLYTITNDIIRLQSTDQISKDYTFYYPDLVLRRRHGDIWDQGATFESIAGPFIIIKHRATSKQLAGYLIYYNRPGTLVEEFEYLLDCFSRFQMLDSGESIRLRVVNPGADGDLKSRFDTAVRKYARAWGFDESRQKVLESITVERVTAVTATYDPGDMGWK